MEVGIIVPLIHKVLYIMSFLLLLFFIFYSGTLQSNVHSKCYRSISAEDDTVLLSRSSAAFEGVVTKPRSKTLPRNFSAKQPSADMVNNKQQQPTKKTPPPIPLRSPLVMQYQGKNTDGLTSPFRHSESNSISSQSSTPSIPEESTTPPLSPKVPSPPVLTLPSPELCTPETKQPEQAEGISKLTPQQLLNDDVFHETSPKGQSSPKGKKKLLSGLKSTFRRRPKSAGEEKSMTLTPDMNREHIIIAHRRVKSVKEEIPSKSRGI